MTKLYILFLLMTFSCSSMSRNTLYRVERIVDGDTLVLEKIGKVRLIGVDTPETVDRRKPVQYFGKEASLFLKNIALGKEVSIEYDQNKKDRYGRALGYLFLPDGTLINLKIIEEGYGFAYTKYPFKRIEEFRKAEARARTIEKGLWANRPITTSKGSVLPISPVMIRSYECVYKTCKQMTSCEEARYHLQECGFDRLDRDGDGVPCENVCR